MGDDSSFPQGCYFSPREQVTVQIDKEKKAWIIFHYSLLYSASTSPSVFPFLSFTFRRKKCASSFFLLASLLRWSCCPSVVEAAQTSMSFQNRQKEPPGRKTLALSSVCSCSGLPFITGVCRAALGMRGLHCACWGDEEMERVSVSPGFRSREWCGPVTRRIACWGKAQWGPLSLAPRGWRGAWPEGSVVYRALAGAALLGKGRGAGLRLRCPPSQGGAGAASLLWCAHFCHRLTFRKESFCW